MFISTKLLYIFIRINPDNRTEGYSFDLIGCPIAKHARETDMLNYFHICAGLIILLQRYLMQDCFVNTPRYLAEIAVTIGMLEIKVLSMRELRRYE